MESLIKAPDSMEKPCRPHIRLSQINDFNIPIPGNPVFLNSGPSHAYTASAGLMHYHQSHSLGSSESGMPRADIDKLLDASMRLNLEKDFTPVQVWSNLCVRCPTGQISQEKLQAITKEFSTHFRCDR